MPLLVPILNMETIRFESIAQRQAARNFKREVQEQILEKAKDEYYKQKAKERERNLNTWMLPSVSARIQNDDDGKMKIKDGRKKQIKDKRKQHLKEISTTSDSSELSEVDEWVEKEFIGTNATEKLDATAKLERDSWMTLPSTFVPTLSKQEIKLKKKHSSSHDEQDTTIKKLSLDKPGQHDRELNPYWKDGGIGLPVESSDSPKGSVNQPRTVGDGGLKWLQKAYRRAIEQAREENRTLEEVAAERWGSLKNLENMLNVALKNNKGNLCLPDTSSHDRYRSHGHHNRQIQPFHSGKQNTSKHYSCDDGSAGSSVLRHKHSDLDKYMNTAKSEEQLETAPHYKKSFGKASTAKFLQPGNDDDLVPTATSNSTSVPKKNRPKWKKDTPTSSATESIPGVSLMVEVVPQSNSMMKNEQEISSIEPSSGACRPLEYLTDKEMNELGAKMIKAELMGDTEMLAKLKSKLEAARQSRKPGPPNSSESTCRSEEKVVILTRTDKKGFTRPLSILEEHSSVRQESKRKQVAETHDKGGKRTKYFADDDQYSLKQMFEREKLGTAEEQNAVIERLATRGLQKTNEDYDIDDFFVSRASRKSHEAKMDAHERLYAINEYKRSNAAIEKCHHCIDSKNMAKHLVIAMGMKSYLCLPEFQSLTEGHCLILPMQHITGATFLDEDVWSDIQVFRKGLTKMFEQQQRDVVFFETCMNMKYYPHMVYHCIPLPKEVGSLAPMYFKKAILESETEWAQNKKLVDLNKKDVRKAIPKGLPYFSVNFGLQEGFAHVIEDEKLFPKYFGQEIIGGMLDLDPTAWRRPPRETFDEQCKKVLQFAEWWRPYDWTCRLKE